MEYRINQKRIWVENEYNITDDSVYHVASFERETNSVDRPSNCGGSFNEKKIVSVGIGHSKIKSISENEILFADEDEGETYRIKLIR